MLIGSLSGESIATVFSLERVGKVWRGIMWALVLGLSIYSVFFGSVLTGLLALLVASGEECLFRGVILEHFQQRMSFLVASSLNSLLFALVHVDFWSQAGRLFAMSMLLCFLRWRWRTLALPVVVHLADNVLG